MKAVKKKFLVSELVAAIEENGFEHLRGDWVHGFDNKLTGGCVLGQGGLNLNALYSGAIPWYITKKIDNWEEISEQWDDGHYPGTVWEELDKFPNISQKYNSQNFLNLTGLDDEDLSTCNRVIVAYNDAKATLWSTSPYLLPTYAEVTEMVRDVLAPYMNEEIELWTVDYSQWIAPKVNA